MKRAAQPALSLFGEATLGCYERRFCVEEDLSAVTIKYREFLLNATARVALLAYDPFLARPHDQDAAPLFRSEKRHTRLTERGLGYLVKKYAEQAKLRDVSPHDLRHRFGYCMAWTVSLHRLAQLIGHDSLDMTMIYVQATKQDLQQAVETIAWT